MWVNLSPYGHGSDRLTHGRGVTRLDAFRKRVVTEEHFCKTQVRSQNRMSYNRKSLMA